jgi:hypothetical protein
MPRSWSWRFLSIWLRVVLIGLDSTFDAGMSAKFTNNPGTGGGSCFGDSGGPIFYDDTNMVVAVCPGASRPASVSTTSSASTRRWRSTSCDRT